MTATPTSASAPAPAPYVEPRFYTWLRVTVASWRYPLYLGSVLILFSLLLLTILLWPASASTLGSFAEEFRVWCFGYNPATGAIEWAYIAMLIGQPAVLAVFIVGVWWRPIRDELSRDRLQVVPVVGLAAVTVAAIALGFGTFDAQADTSQLPFPAEEIRTAHAAPPVAGVVNQDGDPIDIASLQGRVVLLTAVYARCSATCPMIMGQAKRAVAELTPEQRADLTVIGVSLDPEHDDPAVLTRMAEGQGVSAPTFNLVTGEPAHVEALLDDMGIARKRDPETGIIDHVNLFLLIDRQGTIAYRFALGDRQERWLTTAMKLLIDEKGSKPGAPGAAASPPQG